MARSSTSFSKGQRPPAGAGRPKGSPNRVTVEMRDALALLLERNAGNLGHWLTQVAEGDPALGIKPDPAKALDIIIRVTEFIIPKLARTEASGVGGAPIRLVISATDAKVG
jgi:hypothetical protein